MYLDCLITRQVLNYIYTELSDRLHTENSQRLILNSQATRDTLAEKKKNIFSKSMFEYLSVFL